jgi:hypothetical protein
MNSLSETVNLRTNGTGEKYELAISTQRNNNQSEKKREK